MGITFEWTIKFGDVLTVAGAFIVAASIIYKRGISEATNSAILTRLVDDFDEMKKEFKSFSAAMSEVATQKMQIGMLMKWYDELRHGQGFVRGSRSSVDGEYPPS
ncbi:MULTISPECIES: hypothetical protein [unclassified Bradyrhizobium]|uniref:hypothetical protein n=1 Tax=unclassified Bradyrhizobium TaxID=2631580 RepID=UPI00247A055A|nr:MULTISPECIES: hypothetical protein [unclassified Bradyrhizobium]WGR74353.1 hypothetical protein MTX24_16645 [Bradyrhizobium sp. ISRA426]WGR79188.1 hypothetical protein MTX21_01760 [Bradyrhizobium sp. ISRA430]WGR90609.1 hypothetical protein MTX25_39570 [Bradyrhizobium sp. ISRA432]